MKRSPKPIEMQLWSFNNVKIKKEKKIRKLRYTSNKKHKNRPNWLLNKNVSKTKNKSKFKDYDNYRKRHQTDRHSWMLSEPNEQQRPMRELHEKKKRSKQKSEQREVRNYNMPDTNNRRKSKECLKNKQEQKKLSLKL